MKTDGPQPPHRRGTFHRRLQPLYTEKHKVSCSGFLPNPSPMQHSCSHYNACWKHHVSNLHVSTHMATKRDTNHAAIPVRSATTSKTPYNYTHTNASKAASSHRCSAGTKKHHTGRPATAAHTRATFPRRLQPLFTEKPKVSYSGFLSNPSPMQHSCSHYIAFCIITCLTRMSRRMATKRDTNHAAISLRSATTDSKTPDNYTYTHKRIQRSFRAPLQCGNQKHENERTRNRLTHTSCPYIAACSHFTRKNARFRAPASNPSPMQHPCSHYNAFCSITSLTDTNHAAMSLRSAATDSKTR